VCLSSARHEIACPQRTKRQAVAAGVWGDARKDRRPAGKVVRFMIEHGREAKMEILDKL
jgi:hypothetical protein